MSARHLHLVHTAPVAAVPTVDEVAAALAEVEPGRLADVLPFKLPPPPSEVLECDRCGHDLTGEGLAGVLTLLWHIAAPGECRSTRQLELELDDDAQ